MTRLRLAWMLYRLAGRSAIGRSLRRRYIRRRAKAIVARVGGQLRS